jgi:hypothetical protein
MKYDDKANDSPFSNALTLGERESLAFRVLHLFLRALASELPFIVLRDAVSLLDQTYVQKKYFEQALDINIIRADVCMTTVATADQDPWDIVMMLMFVGEYAESTAKVNQDHNQAGCVYEFITRAYGSKVSFHNCALIHHHAALAFRNGQDMNKAEEHLIAAWHTLCSGTGAVGVDINGCIATNIFTSLLIMYAMLFEKEKSRQRSTRQTAADRDITNIYPLLCALLYLAGFQARQGGNSHTSVFQVGSQNAQVVFRGRLDQQSVRNILMEAGARSDPNHFRQTILQTKGDVAFSASFSGHSSFPGIDDVKRNSQIMMKKQLKEREELHGPRITSEPCYNCRAKQRPNGEPNLRCPCHKAAYCSKECQVSHRKEHTKYCTVVPKKEK